MDQNHELQSPPFLLKDAYVQHPPMIHFKIFILLKVLSRIKEEGLNHFSQSDLLLNPIKIMK